MKLICYLSLFLVIILSAGCEDHESPELSISTSVLSLKSYDVGNEGNASDIAVNIVLSSLDGNSDIWFIIIPESFATELTTKILNGLSVNQYLEIKSTAELSYSTEMSPNQLDINGELITSDANYMIRAYFPGTNTISEPSTVVRLANVGIYNGTYSGELSFLGALGLMEVNLEGIPGSNVYTGDVRFPELAGQSPPNPFDSRVYATMRLVVSNDDVNEFTITVTNEFVENIAEFFSCIGLGNHYTGEGKVINFARMSIDFAGKNCGDIDDEGTIVLDRI